MREDPSRTKEKEIHVCVKPAGAPDVPLTVNTVALLHDPDDGDVLRLVRVTGVRTDGQYDLVYYLTATSVISNHAWPPSAIAARVCKEK